MVITKPARWQGFAGAAAFITSVAALVILSNAIAPPVTLYVAILVLGSALVSVLLWRESALGAKTVLGVALLAHIIALFGQTIYEDDFYRFIWDGWRVWEAGTPYGVPPLDFLDDPDVPPALAAVLEWVNYPELPTLYGPTLQVLFALAYALAGSNELGLRVLFAGTALLLSALLLRRHAPQRAALFAWNPVVVAESTIHLHPDILLALFLFLGLFAGKRHPALAGLFLGLAAGAKIVALAAWPILLRIKPAGLFAALITLGGLYGVFALQGQGIGLETTETFATRWYFNPQAFFLFDVLLGPDAGRLAALAVAGLIVVWLHASARGFDTVPLAAIFGVILLFAPAVNTWYILWLLPLALDRRDIWPYVASAVLPLSYLTGLNLEILALQAFEVHPIALRAEWVLIGGAIIFDIVRNRKAASGDTDVPGAIVNPAVSVVIPALNEEQSVGASVSGILAAGIPGLAEVIVADNGSTDNTACEARKAGAIVVAQPERGYGAACLAALAAADRQSSIILFMDADFSDNPAQAAALLAPIIVGEADMVIGSRRLGDVEPGAMSAPQRFGNWLAPALVRLIWGTRYTDLGPFRAIRREALERLRMADRDFGWTIEMQVRAAKVGLRTMEVPVSYRRRVGVSKISGTVKGVIAAGWKILFVIAREAFGDFDSQAARLAKPKQGPDPASAAPDLPAADRYNHTS